MLNAINTRLKMKQMMFFSIIRISIFCNEKAFGYKSSQKILISPSVILYFNYECYEKKWLFKRVTPLTLSPGRMIPLLVMLLFYCVLHVPFYTTHSIKWAIYGSWSFFSLSLLNWNFHWRQVFLSLVTQFSYSVALLFVYVDFKKKRWW